MSIDTTPQAPQLPQQPPAKRPWVARHKILTGIGALVAVMLVGGALGSGDDTTTTATSAAKPGAAADPATVAGEARETHASKPKPKPVKVAPETNTEPQFTVAQEQAIESAQSYLSLGGFSRAGLIQQLSSKAGEGFNRSDAVLAVDHIRVDWNKQAVESAKSYLQMGGFSRASLIQQLSSNAGERFTLAQATYAANHLGL